ncbi:ornithine carbamoyltransferase [Natronobacterium gregoryi]|uniref:Ornithine carbamoyltransferase n=2 Tax=Natronobacterium gregoryi TaxID=44930 RepID=L0ADK5_NATGS|nr:ornithine carbamoyltransferase [Natronobacterium gregoryi]AFZ71936.1 ornithine carbamoyltransferase [Natronobacterium gregoryi SP2]ELY62568.1 ornithine carbamoyltransferase [Natronobacterium gregoryi SP2]PLK20715.1 ornithine carbamoyltransferase [Natronobacterium gregoryi SP2]SFJ13393.1 ornithine carbamoyltransferase [Natronobacterium gregoryi]
MQHLVDINDVETEEIEQLFELTDEMKENPGEFSSVMDNKTLVMLFAKPSTRTRLSFETGMTQLGGHGIFFEMGSSQLSRGEPISDVSQVMSRYEDAIMARLFEHDEMLELAEHAEVPVINGLTDFLHPCQALTDLYTLHEKDRLDTIAFVGDGNNVAHSLMQASAKMDVDCRIATPEGMEPDEEIQERVSDADVMVTNDPYEAVDDATAVYSDVFVSMGEEEEREEKLAKFDGFQVDQDLMDAARDDAVFMHCLPAHRGEEVTAEVADGPQSVIFDQAENRMHIQKAIIHTLVNE